VHEICKNYVSGKQNGGATARFLKSCTWWFKTCCKYNV